MTMISRNLYINIILRVILIVVMSVFLGYLIVKGQSFRISTICFLTVVFMTISLISYLNSTNKKISYFFDSVRNDDSSLSFPLRRKTAVLMLSTKV